MSYNLRWCKKLLKHFSDILSLPLQKVFTDRILLCHCNEISSVVTVNLYSVLFK